MKKRLISAALASVMALSTLPSAFAANAGLSNFERTKTYTDGQFTDVSASAWYAEYVKDAFELDLVSGNSDTTFNPNGNLTIAEAVVLACNLHNIYYAEGKRVYARQSVVSGICRLCRRKRHHQRRCIQQLYCICNPCSVCADPQRSTAGRRASRH